MSRYKAREQAFALLFEKAFNDLPIGELAEAATEARDLELEPHALVLATGVEAHLDDVDEQITAHSHKWSNTRISKVALAILRLAIYEMLYVEDTPTSVAINEAVELAKRYGGEEDSSFVNGVLGGVARQQA